MSHMYACTCEYNIHVKEEKGMKYVQYVCLLCHVPVYINCIVICIYMYIEHKNMCIHVHFVYGM